MNSLLLPAFYLPPISYFAVLANTNSEDNIWIEAYENLPKQTYRNRCYVYSANGKLALSIPLQHNGSRSIKDIVIADNTNWQHLHWKSIKIAYQSSAFFEYYEDVLVPIFQMKEKYLLDFNLKSTDILIKLLKFEINYAKTTSYEKTNIAKDYREHFLAKKENSIEMERYFQNFEHKNGFIKDLSIIDLLCNIGPESRQYLKKINIK